ncbi:hypothetical protein CLAFUW4_02339 [Fulvia fulva]|uniref:Uncharacterized protein n=1 Tax=Passalora fulva TaxID=5499 RepID=A0A9Q8P5E9_PASFU|nr:uncharacterized protein CLAFUR5_02328 [Fulvia fulva]KAK4631800.1 hypothetical protein CLAFUR4_02334 [Fulvia fulva]KAK4633652.1 hypothetical protein CLAFUR0_02338 [Fulvia fulva]UJO13697.1 hypothetical protein CLAFUR5_02328 [Fulvia fulva]WPV11192.1 hypothetical protein CLAFUW4_02339 [Fulvia fulva]WPV25810.1 hypothetical protein CLAFUW7_02339 [Fulvia fulva]
MATQAEGEPRLFRAVPGFINNLDQGPEEVVVPRMVRQWLRSVADRSRSPLWKLPVMSGGAGPGLTVRDDVTGEVYLKPGRESALRQETHGELMQEFYAAVEPLLVSQDELPPDPFAIKTPISANASGNSAKVVLQEEQTLPQALSSGRKDVEEAQNWLEFGLPKTYRQNRQRYLLTYREDPYVYDAPDVQSPDDAFDRRFLARIRDANDRIRASETRSRELQNEALAKKAADAEERDLFGILDHANDGFTESMGSEQRGFDGTIAAEKWPNVHKWLQSVDPMRSPAVKVEPPAEVVDIVTSASVRSALSCVEPEPARRDVIQRLEAERLVTRAEEQERWLEHYRVLGVPPPRSIY